MQPKISFKPIESRDIEQVFTWVHQPEIARWYQETSNWEDFQQKFEQKSHSEYCFGFMVYIDDVPIGYMQYYLADKVGNNWWPEEKAGTVGIDQFIGNLDYLGKGFGTQFISEFIQKKLLIQKFVNKIIVDVDPENKRAIRCYQKVGFNEVGLINTPDGIALLMIYAK